MNFKKYQHIERFGTDEVEGIELGKTYIFPKIDGTNSSVWMDDGVIMAGSRKRQLSFESDNAGFYDWVVRQENIYKYLRDHPEHRLYGEWLVPHSLKTYRDDAWKRFYVFDVCIDTEDSVEYLVYEDYQPLLEEYGIDYIPCIATIKNGSYEQFINWLQHNTFLIEDGKGIGEGIVIKNYGYHNKYGRQTWAKIVTSEFKEKHAKTLGAPEVKGKKMIEEEIAERYCTRALITKTFEKIKSEKGWSSKSIPELLSRVYHDVIAEESWNIVKEYKMPSINYRTLNHFIVSRVKSEMSEVF